MGKRRAARNAPSFGQGPLYPFFGVIVIPAAPELPAETVMLVADTMTRWLRIVVEVGGEPAFYRL
jgi:hypothetical protein